MRKEPGMTTAMLVRRGVPVDGIGYRLLHFADRKHKDEYKGSFTLLRMTLQKVVV
jgi:hypothetical protein